MLFRESDTVELKETYIDEIRKEIIAFANTNGGIVYIGVRDDGSVVGIENSDETIQRLTNSVRDTIKPDLTMFLRYETVDIDNKQIVAVHVQRGTARPYYIGAKGLKPSGVTVRQGTSSAPASDMAIRQMIKETDGDSFEDMRSMNQDLSFYEVKNAFMLRGLDFGMPQMQTLGLINSENMYTNLALLLSDQCPHIIKVAVFSGIDQEQFQDRREFSGSLLKQLNDAYAYLDMRNQTMATFQGLLRTDCKDYPESALRESLLNAIVHKDYSFSASTLISIYKDRIEFVSIGGLVGGISMDDVLLGLSVCRNPKLAAVFYRLKLIEAYGTGLKKIVNAYLEEPEKAQLLATTNAFKVILPNVNYNRMNPKQGINLSSKIDSQEVQIIHLIEEKGEIVRKDVENELGMNATAAIRLLRKMQDAGEIQRKGKGKNVCYFVS